MHQVVSVLFTLIEMKYFGYEYQKNTVRIANLLAKELEKIGLNVASKNDNYYTKTHQIFLEMSEEEMKTMFNNALMNKITLNARKKLIFRGGFGIRLGTQEISRYNWNNESITKIAEILYIISKQKYDYARVKNILSELPKKKVGFTFNKNEYENIISFV